MRKLLTLIIFPFILLSCQKSKDATIVGDWMQIERYSKDENGQFSWHNMSDGYANLSFSQAGTYRIVLRDPVASGNYQYNYATRQLKLVNPLSGNANVVPVSYLDDDYLVIDWMYNGELINKDKYQRR